MLLMTDHNILAGCKQKLCHDNMTNNVDGHNTHAHTQKHISINKYH